MTTESQATPEIVRSLQEQIRGWERERRGPAEIVSSGLPALDRLLADGGFCRGTLVEWLAGEQRAGGVSPRMFGRVEMGASRGSGAATLALAIAARVSRETGALVVVDRPRMFYPPAAAGWGIDEKEFVIVRPRNDREEAWTLDQVLRSPGVAAVLCWPGKLGQRRFRQMQLAAEAGGALGMIVRPEWVREEPSWAEMRLLVGGRKSEVGSRKSDTKPFSRDPQGSAERRSTERPSIRLLRIDIIRSRGGAAGGAIELELDEQTGVLYEPHTLDLAPRLAAPAIGGCSTGA